MLAIRFVAVAFALCPAAVAQQMLIVDPTGGGQFLTVNAALAAAAPGDTVFVRGGSYGGQHVIPGSLQIVGDPALPRPFLGSVQIVPGTGGGVSIVHAGIGTATIQASAVLDKVTVSQFFVHAGSVVLSHCDAFWYTSRVLGGDVVLNDCSLSGRPATYQQTLGSCLTYPALPALEVAGGRVAIANSNVVGGSGGMVCLTFPVPGVPSTAVMVVGGQVRATRSQFVGGSHASGALTPAVTVQAGTFAFDPSTTFIGLGSPPGAAIFLPATDGRSAPSGGTITATLQTGPGLAALLVASLGRGVSMPSFAGAVWFDPANYVVLAFGGTDAMGRLGASIPVPPGIPPGTAITAQGGAIESTGAAIAATPVVVHVQ